MQKIIFLLRRKREFPGFAGREFRLRRENFRSRGENFAYGEMTPAVSTNSQFAPVVYFLLDNDCRPCYKRVAFQQGVFVMDMRFRISLLWLAALCAVGGSSCVSRKCMWIWREAYVVDNAWWLENASAELYRCGDAIYAKGRKGQAKGGWLMSSAPFDTPVKTFNPVSENSTTAYLRLDDASARQVRKKVSANHGEPPIVGVRLSQRTEDHLLQLPDDAKLLPVKAAGYYTCANESEAYACPEKYWRFPLSVLTAVAVDAPLTVVQNAIGATVFIVFSPIALPGGLMQYISEQQAQPDLEQHESK